MAPPRIRFDFLCSEEACRALGAKITATNYDKHPQDTHKAAHFSLNPRYSHADTCEWIIDHDEEGPDGRLRGESEDDARRRRAKSKLDDYIDAFDPMLEAKASDAIDEISDSDQVEARTVLNRSADRPTTARASKDNKTSDFERLVESYRQAKKELDDEEFRSLKLRIKGQGEVSLRWYFQHIKYAKLGATDRVLMGGGDLLAKRYGKGFKIQFRDKIDDKPVFLYISSEQMMGYKSQRYIEDLLSLADTVRFYTVFALGRIVLSPSTKSIGLEVNELRHLVLVPGKKK
jgi:hypothetical protein